MYVLTSWGAMEADARFRWASLGFGEDVKEKSQPNSNIEQISSLSKYPWRANFHASSGKEGCGNGIRRLSMFAGELGRLVRD